MTVTISQAMIDEVLARKFPKEKIYVKFVKVTYLNPRAVMVPTEEKVRVEIEVQVDLGIKGFSKSYRGSAGVITKVGYEPSTAEFFLHQAQLVALDVPKIGKDDLEMVREGLNLALAELVERVPVYRLKQQDFKTSLTRTLLKGVEIRHDRVVATLGL